MSHWQLVNMNTWCSCLQVGSDSFDSVYLVRCKNNIDSISVIFTPQCLQGIRLFLGCLLKTVLHDKKFVNFVLSIVLIFFKQ